MERSPLFYTLLAYKADSADYCRGCHMASYSSDFECWTGVDADAIAQRWADLLERNGNLAHGESGFDIELLINGLPAYFDSYLTTSAGSIPDDVRTQQDALQPAYDALKHRAEELLNEKLAKKAAAAAEEARQAALAKEAAALKAAADKERHERAEFERLSQKFAGGAA